ncbi:MAG: hypothetical protein JXR85_11480 [Deltaproteobacteria bacterium]|jgi:hypothetical protein|nr:hypothetical protein [Deltaproteobacteria bacterium]
MNFDEVLFAFEYHSVCSTLDLFGSVNGSNAATWARRIHKAVYPGNGGRTKAPRGCGGCAVTFPAREDMKIFEGCADDLFAEQSR